MSLTALTTNETQSIDPVKDFLDSVYMISHSEKTVKQYQTSINHLKKFIKTKYNHTELDQILPKIQETDLAVYRFLRDFTVYLDSLQIKPRGIRAYVSGVKKYLRHNGIRVNTDDFKQFVNQPKLIRMREIPLTKEMIVRILRNANSKLQTAILVATSSGMRIEELVQLQLSDIDFESYPTKITI